MVLEAARLIDFVKEAFGAIEALRKAGSANGIHVELRIGDSVLTIGAETAAMPATPVIQMIPVAPVAVVAGVGRQCLRRSTSP
jgi:uncharacterized glyoxalase superfamily protein PhnB